MERLLKKYRGVIDRRVDRHYVRLGTLGVNLAVGDPLGCVSGRLLQCVGRESSGKSTWAMEVVKQYQEDYPDRHIVWIDFERSWDWEYAKRIGVKDVKTFILFHPENAEQGFDFVLESITEGARLVIIDSIATAPTKAELDKKLDENAKMAALAGLLTRWCNHVIPLLFDKDATVIALNQFRKNFSTLSPVEEVPFGGMALQYATSVLLALARIKTAPDKQRTQLIVKKNKTARPQCRAEFNIIYGEGIDTDGSIIEMAKDYGIVTLSGSWYNYKEHKAQGLEGAVATLPIEEIKLDLIARVLEGPEDVSDVE